MADRGGAVPPPEIVRSVPSVAIQDAPNNLRSQDAPPLLPAAQGEPKARLLRAFGHGAFDWCAGLARQRDRGGAELAVGADADRLPIAGGAQRNIAIEAGGARDHVEIASATAALKSAADVAAGLAPGA